MTQFFNIETRQRKRVHDGRCYNGAFAFEKFTWSNWEILEYKLPESVVERKLKFWKELNADAVSHRGEDARREHRSVPFTETIENHN